MTMQNLLIIAVLSVFLIEILYYRKTKHPLACAFTGVLSGVILLIPAVFVLAQFGSSLVVNYTTLAISAALGIPGVALMTAFMLL